MNEFAICGEHIQFAKEIADHVQVLKQKKICLKIFKISEFQNFRMKEKFKIQKLEIKSSSRSLIS